MKPHATILTPEFELMDSKLGTKETGSCTSFATGMTAKHPRNPAHKLRDAANTCQVSVTSVPRASSVIRVVTQLQ